jgi:hypothetical protein
VESSPNSDVKKVNSQVNIDEKTGKIVSSSTNSDNSDYSSNFDSNQKEIVRKMLKLQSSSSLPDLKMTQNSDMTSCSTATTSSNSSNIVHGKHVILAVEAQNMNQMDGSNGCVIDDVNGDPHVKKNVKMNFNIDPTFSNGSSSTTSSNNLEYTIGSNSTL